MEERRADYYNGFMELNKGQARLSAQWEHHDERIKNMVRAINENEKRINKLDTDMKVWIGAASAGLTVLMFILQYVLK